MWLGRILGGIIIAVAIGLVCLFIGGLLASLGAPPAEFAGDFLRNWAWVIGSVLGLWFALLGGFNFPPTINRE